jgi:hypothetical protein
VINIALPGTPFAGAVPQGLDMAEFLLNAVQLVFFFTSPLTLGLLAGLLYDQTFGPTSRAKSTLARSVVSTTT